jgi:ElaA protein
MSAGPVHIRTFQELDPLTLYRLLALRVEVFVVEQDCPYPELDGRDTEPGARHAWIPAADGSVLACLRILDEPDSDALRIGRVAAAQDVRGTGLGARLMRTALEAVGPRRVLLDSQTYAAGFYERFGFIVTGEEFLEDGIAHVPMARPASTP